MNDIILNMLANDSFTVSDFKAVGLTAENTKLESEDKYLQSEKIQENELFKDNGVFNKDLFHQYYLLATDFYNKMADDTYIEDLSKTTFYSKDNLFAPEGSKKIDETPVFVTVPNPFLQSNSLTRVGKKGDRTLSISEIAQSQKIYDTKSQTFKEESVNDRALGNSPLKWLGDIFSEPLVIAQWDEDGEHKDLITGEIKSHKKGDYKYNADGTFYYETLGGRDVYGKQVLNKMNTLTVDGSKFNKYDFFDSDDLEQKSAVGTVLKNLALVGSMFIPWNVGYVIRAASIASQSVGLMGALGKIFLGSDSEFANNTHAWAKTVNRQSSTEYASQNTWCWENILNLIGDSVGQIAEQRFIFTHVPALFKGTKGLKAQNAKTHKELVEKAAKEIQEKTGKDLAKAVEDLKSGLAVNPTKAFKELGELQLQHKTISELKAATALEKYMESYNKLGSILSKTYMTGITVQDTYGEAKANGASDWEAIGLTLGYAAGELAILNSPIGEWIMPELHGDKLKYKALINALKNEVKPLTEDVTKTATKEARQNIFKQIINIGKRAATNDYALSQFASKTINPTAVILANAASESFEELSEEVLADVSKSTFNVINWLRGDETRISGAWENMLDRYGMSVLGGFLGGGISSAGTDFKYVQSLGKMTNETAIQELIYMINNDKIDGFLKYVNKATLGNKYLSTDLDENGNNKPGTKENNQDLEIKKVINNQVQLLKNTINAEGAKFSENSLFDALTLKDLRYAQLRNTTTLGMYFQEYNSLISEIVKTHERIKEISNKSTDTDTKKEELSKSDEKELKELNEKLEELRVKKDAIVSGKRAPEFIAAALYEAQQMLHMHKKGYTFDGYVKAKKNKSVDELSDSEIKSLKESYKTYRETEMENDIMGDARQFIDLVGLASGAIQNQQDYVNSLLDSGKREILKIQNSLGEVLNVMNTALKSGELDSDTLIQKIQNNFSGLMASTAEQFIKPLITPEIQERLDYINNTPDTINYGEYEKNLDKVSTLYEVFADYADNITQKFIDQGYIHPEVKNHLINTYNSIIDILSKMRKTETIEGSMNPDVSEVFSAYVKSKQEDYITHGNRNRLLRDYIKNLNQKIDQLKELNHTPIIELIENFKTSTSESNTSVKDVMEYVNNLFNQGQEDLSSFGYNSNIEEQIDEIDEIIDVIASALYATRVDESGVNNAWGYSKTLNELNKKYKNDQWIELAEIEGNTADLLQSDLAILKQKIHFVKNLRALNNGQKLNKQNKVGYNKQYIFYNKFKHWVNELPDDLKGWNLESIKSVLREDLLLSKYNHDSDNRQRKFGLTNEEKIQIEKESLMIDDAIYKFFEDNSDKLNNVDELVKIINPTIFNLYNPARDILTDETNDLDDRQFIFTLAAKAAIKGSAFYDKLRKTFSDKKAPVPMQEQAVLLNVAMIVNGNVMNNFAKAYSKSLFEHFENLSPDEKRKKLELLGRSVNETNGILENIDAFKIDEAVEKFANIVLTEGIAGSGKTKGVFDSTKKIIEQIDPSLLENVFVVNSTLGNAKSLMDDLNLKGKIFTSSHEEIKEGLKNKNNVDIIRYFYSDYDDNYKDKVKFINNNVVTSFTLKKDLTNLPKIIFIDEASRYDYIQMKLLSEAAQHYGIVILAAGDFDQISASSTIESNGQVMKFRPNRLNFIGSSKLGLSFRTLNSQMSKLQKSILSNLYSDENRFNTYYWENESELRGFKRYDKEDFDEIVNSINKIKNQLETNEKIGFLYVDKDASLHEKLKEKFGDLLDIKSVDDAQGLEGNYYILDLNRPSFIGDLTRAKQEFYTGITRAKVGGIIISNNDPHQDIIINNVQEKSSELESITPEDIAKVSQKRKDLFDEIFKDSEEELIKYVPITRVERESEIIPPKEEESETDEGIPPTNKPISVQTVPNGMYKTKEEAEKIDLSIYKSGLELYEENNLIGTIQGAGVKEHVENEITYYVPVVTVTQQNGEPIDIYAHELIKYTLKDPSSQLIIPKYKVGDIFYDSEGKPIEIIEVIVEDPVKYKIKDDKGTVTEILESDLLKYSTIKPEFKKPPQLNLGENDPGKTYRKRIEKSNGSNLRPNIDSNGKITHWMHTFNSYETGVVWTDRNQIDPRYFDESDVIGLTAKSRIDNANGLLQLGALKKTSTKQDCLDILANIHSLLMYNKDNSDILQQMPKLLNLNDNPFASIEYGIKSSAGLRHSDEYPQYDVFAKNPEEKSEYANSSVEKSDVISNKNIVAVFRDNKGEKILEITMGVLNSPITLGQTTNEKDEFIYPEIAEILSELHPGLSNEEEFKIVYKALNKAKEIKEYVDLYHLFKAYLYTSTGFAPLTLENEEFNLAKQINFGPKVIMSKGEYQKDKTRQYEVNYTDLDNFVKDNRKVVSQIYIPKTNDYGGKIYPIHPGYAGVFVSYNKSYSESELAKIYMDQLNSSYTGNKDVDFYYIIPPEATVKEYLKNMRNVYLNKHEGENNPIYKIGNLWTSYNLLKNIYLGEDFTKEKFKSKVLNYVESIDEITKYIDELRKLEVKDWSGDENYKNLVTEYKNIGYGDIAAKTYAKRNIILEEQEKILRSPFNSSKISVAKMFSNYLANAAYFNKDAKEPDENIINIITKHNPDNIKYKIEYDANDKNEIGMFIPAKINGNTRYQLSCIREDGSVESRSCLINDKIDSPIFEIPALTNAIGILADWEFSDPDDTSKMKNRGTLLNAGTYSYINNKLVVEKQKTNFEILQDNNKELFGNSGLFNNINVRGKNDPSLNQIQLAEELLKEFNSKPDNVGFAIVQSNGDVKLYAIKVSNSNDIAKQTEASNGSGGLGGITIGIPLIFKTTSDQIKFETDLNNYSVRLDGTNIVFNQSAKETPIKTTKIELSKKTISVDEFNNVLQNFKNKYSEDETFKILYSQGMFDFYELSMNPDLIDSTLMFEESFTADSAKKYFDLIKKMKINESEINVKIGDIVSKNEKGTEQFIVSEINGSEITLENVDDPIDINNNSLYKIDDDQIIVCTKPIEMSYV